MPAISRRALAGAVAARLATVANATGYVGQVGAMHGLPGVDDTPADPPQKSPHDLRVTPYFILFPGIGSPTAEVDTAETWVDLDWPIQVTAAAGDVDDLLALVDRLQAALWRWSPGPLPAPGDGVFLTGPLRPPPGFSIAFPLVDRTHDPDRLYVPLQYQLTAHT